MSQIKLEVIVRMMERNNQEAYAAEKIHLTGDLFDPEHRANLAAQFDAMVTRIAEKAQ